MCIAVGIQVALLRSANVCETIDTTHPVMFKVWDLGTI